MQTHSINKILTKNRVHLHKPPHYQYFEDVIRIQNTYFKLQKIHVAVTQWTKINPDTRKLTDRRI